MSTYCYLTCIEHKVYCAACTRRGGSLVGDEHLRDFMIDHIDCTLRMMTEHDDLSTLTDYEDARAAEGRPVQERAPSAVYVDAMRLKILPVGERVQALRMLGRVLRAWCPEAADHLEAYTEGGA